MDIQKWKWFVQFPQMLLIGLLLQGPKNLNEQRWFNIFRESSFVKCLSIDKGLFMLNKKACWDIRVTVLIGKGKKIFLESPFAPSWSSRCWWIIFCVLREPLDKLGCSTTAASKPSQKEKGGRMAVLAKCLLCSVFQSNAQCLSDLAISRFLTQETCLAGSGWLCI